MIYFSIKEFNVFDDLDDSKSYLLIIKNKKLLYSFVNDMREGSIELEYFQFYNEDNKLLSSTDYIDFIPSLFYLELNSKRNVSTLFKILKANCRSDFNQFIKNLENELEGLFNILKYESPVEIEKEIDIDDNDILMLLNLSIFNPKDDLLSNIINYINVCFELRKTKVFVFYNLLCFLTLEEIESILNFCKLHHISIVNIEYDKLGDYNFDIVKIIDDDLCLLEKL